MKKFVSSKKPGNILSAFQANINDTLPERYKTIKKDIVQRCGADNLQTSWTRLIESFDNEIQVIKEKGPNVIPKIEFSAILKNNFTFPSTFADEIRKRGCVLVRNVVDSSEALKYKEDVRQYIKNHEGNIVGFPGEILLLVNCSINFMFCISKPSTSSHHFQRKILRFGRFIGRK